MNHEPVSILLVEDDPGDVLLIREALAEHERASTVADVGDGVEALRYIRAEGEYAQAAPPDLVLLDLNLPRKNGAEVLAEIKADPRLSRIPVVVLSTSSSAKDVVRSYESHASAFITKPADFERFREVVSGIDEFFVGVATLPPTGSGG